MELWLQTQSWKNTIAKLQKLKQNKEEPFEHFDWKLDFPEVLNPYLVPDEKQRGFDIVIANPPYLKERDNAHIFNDVNNSKFGQLWHQGKMDYWFYFLHKAIDINRQGIGVISFITSRYWLNSQGAQKLISRVASNLSFINVVDIGKLKVFDNVAGHHMIHIYKHSKGDGFIYKKLQNNIKSLSNDIENNDLKIRFLSNSKVFRNGSEIIFADDNLSTTIKTCELGSVFDVSQGVVEASDKISSKQYKIKPNPKFHIGQGVFVLSKDELRQLNLNKSESRLIKPYLEPYNVGRYFIDKSEPKYLIYSDKDAKERIAQNSEYRNIKKHLYSLRDYITSSNAPYGLHRARQSAFFENPKIIFKGMFVSPEFCIDYDKFYFGLSFSSIIQKNKNYSLKYLLAILNSKFAKQWFYNNGKLRGAGVDISVEKLRTFPIPTITKQSQFDAFVDYIIFVKSCGSSDTTCKLMPTYFEQIIDGMVYELYFPELIKKHKREIIQHLGELPEFTDKMSDEQKMNICKTVFNRLNDREHPVRVNLEKMKAEIKEIRIIEGIDN